MTPCSICPRKFKPVGSSGPAPSRIMMIGERPGVVENNTRIPFSGPTGDEFNRTYLPLAGLSRSNVYVTNTVKCYVEGNRKPTVKEVEACGAHHLAGELEEVQPEIVILMGATACSLVPEIDLDVEHGIPRQASLYGKEYLVVPMYHPALGLHDTGKMTPMIDDWSRLKDWLWDGGSIRWVTDNGKTDYRLIKDADQLQDYFIHYNPDLIAVDTESHGKDPWSIQVSLQPGTARMVLMEDTELVRELGDWINEALGFNDAQLVFHSAPSDLKITSMVTGFPASTLPYIDSMQMCYHLQNLPQGLKALGYRLCGVRMKSWEEVVGEASRNKLLEWIMERIELEANDPIIEYKQLKTKVKEIQKANGIETALRRIMRHTVESVEYDPWERIQGMGLEGYPLKGIGNCSLKEAVEYGCQDADITLRVALKLEELRVEAEKGWGVRGEDQDVTVSWPTVCSGYQTSH